MVDQSDDLPQYVEGHPIVDTASEAGTGRQTLAVDRSGKGPALIMVHGLGGTLNVWEPQVRALSDSYSVVRFDLPGSGRSPATERLSVDGWVSTIEALMAELGIERAHFVGHSLGTLIIQHFAVRNPQRVDHVALLGVNRAPEEARRQTVRERAAKARQEGMTSIADSVVSSALSSETQQRKPEVVGFVRELVMAQDREGYARSCEAIAESVGADLRKLSSPVMLIAGSEDKVSPVVVSERMAEELEDASLTVVDHCGHWLTLEQPRHVNTVLAQFLHA